MIRLMEELAHKYQQITLYCDSQSVLHISSNPTLYSKTMHKGVQYHFFVLVVEEGHVDMPRIQTDDNQADVMKKSDQYGVVDPCVAYSKHIETGVGKVDILKAHKNSFN